MAERIGACRCPVCGAGNAHASLSKKQWVCVTCNVCRCQVFSRGPQSDELLRNGIAPAPAEPTPAPAAKPAPAPIEPKPAPIPAPAPAPAPRGWGLLG
jgi:hypothetical protein